ncbi:Schlafen family member 12-like [Bienertia sinuspersici]
MLKGLLERSLSCDEVNRRSKKFNDWINIMELLEVEFSGPSHTWARGLSDETRKSARLDRVLCNNERASRFSAASVRYLPTIQSDHCPLLISPNGFVPLEALNKPFRFQAAWLTHEKFQEFMYSNWSNEAPLVPFFILFTQLQQWNKDVFHNIFREKRELMARI